MSSNNKSTRYAASLQPPQTPDSIITLAVDDHGLVCIATHEAEAVREELLENVSLGLCDEHIVELELFPGPVSAEGSRKVHIRKKNA